MLSSQIGQFQQNPGVNGRTNLVLSEMLDKVLEDTKCPFDIALQWCVNAKNSLHNVHGFSPYQLALGQNPRLTALLSDKPPALESNSSSEIIWQNLNALHCARETFIRSENSERLKRAMRHNIRHSNDTVFITGDYVYYKRDSDPKWHGPATVLGQEGQKVLLKHGGFYIRVHRCRFQHVNDPNESQISTSQCKVDAESSHSPKAVKRPQP